MSGRTLHPAAWWLWAAAMAVAAVRTTNPMLLALIAAVVVFVVAARRSDAPWSRSLAVFFRLGLIVIVIRVGVEVVFGQRLPGHTLFSLPRVPLPSWAAGVSIGGPVSLESVVQAGVDGLRLAVILLCFGAANSLASPYRLLRCLPTVLYEAGVAVTVALTFAPEVVIAIGSTREARRLRGRPTRGIAGLRGLAIPVLEGALDRSLQLAASMDARGYGRRLADARRRRLSTGATASGLLLIVLGVFGALDSGSLPAGGIPFLAVGAALLAVGMAAGGHRSPRTRYRADPWRLAEWGVALSGVAVLGVFVAAGVSGVSGLQFSAFPLHAPALPVWLGVGILVGLLPATLAPSPRGWVSRGPDPDPNPVALEPRPSARVTGAAR
ncbi:MAG TPA: energy-coupling factor transporter transmembrane component T [Acidimicrobiales bacterium]|nr:energy-coupling factor transporter transmembrane component T [Acidimicrobiales bacterium]